MSLICPISFSSDGDPRTPIIFSRNFSGKVCLNSRILFSSRDEIQTLAPALSNANVIPEPTIPVPPATYATLPIYYFDYQTIKEISNRLLTLKRHDET